MAENNENPNNKKSDDNETVKSIIYFIVALLVFLLLKSSFEGLYKATFVELFEGFNIKDFTLKQSLFTLLAWLGLNILAFSYVSFLIYKNYRLSLNSYLIGLFSFLLFVFYRYFDTATFVFYPIGTDIKFADISPIYFLFGFILFLKNKYYLVGVIFHGKVKNYLFSKIWVSNIHKNLTKQLITLNKQLIRRKKCCIKILKSFTAYNHYRKLKICLKKGFYKIIRLLRPQKQENIYKNDLPTNTDTLGRNHASDYLANNILGNYSKNALAIGIMGTWGTGKTTFLELTKQSLEAKSQEPAYKSQQLIMIDFNAWFSKKPEQITQDFFDVLKNKIGEYSGELSDEITSYAQKLVTAKEGVIVSILKEVFNIFASKETPAKLYEKINTALQKLNLKLVIFIDDLDRLDKKEIVEVLRIIRNTANFYNTVFVVAYDRNYVINAIKDINDYNKERYLEKIFQLEIALPHTEHSKVIEKLKQWLEKWIESNVEASLQKELLDGDYGLYRTFDTRGSIVNDFIITMRDASRFYNLIITEYNNNVHGEILLEHFILIKLLLFKYPTVYELIVAKKDSFLDLSGFSFSYVKVKEVDKKETKQTIFEEYITNFKDNLLLSTNDIQNCVKVFRVLFVIDINTSHRHLAINDFGGLDKYFANRTMLGKFKQRDFEEISKLNYDITKLIDYTAYKYDFEVRYKNIKVNTLNKEIVKHSIKVILALYYYDCHNHNKLPNNKSKSNLFGCVWYYLRNLNNLSTEEVIPFLKEVFSFAYDGNEKKQLCFNACVASIIYSQIEQMYHYHKEYYYQPIYFPNDMPIFLQKQCATALDKAIKESMYENPNYLIKLYEFNYDITKTINEEYIQYIATKHVEFVLIHLKVFENDYYRLSKERIEKKFGNHKRFEKFLYEEIKETEFVQKYRKAYEDLKERGFDSYFDFQEPK